MAAGEQPVNDRDAETFISYSHKNRVFAFGLRDELKRHGKSVWIDEDDIHPADFWAEEIKRAIEGANAYVFVISPDSAASKYCLEELQYADSLHKRILPVNYHPVREEDVPPLISERQFIPARGGFDTAREECVAQLLTAIDTDLDWVREHTEWGKKAVDWDRHKHDRSYLLSGTELKDAQKWLDRQSGKDPEPTDLQRALVHESRAWSTRRLEIILGAVAAGLVAAVVFAVVALVQRAHADYERDVALALSLRGSAQAVEAANPMLAAQLAAEADTRQQNEQSQEVLRTALADLREIGPLPRGQFNDLSEDGASALTWVSSGSGGFLWQLPSRRLLATVSQGSNGVFAQAAPGPQAGQFAVFGTTAGTIAVLDPATGHTVRVIRTGLQSISDIVAASSVPLVVASDGSDCAIADVATGQVISRIGVCSLPEISPHGTAVSYFPGGPNGTHMLVLNRTTGQTRTITLPGDDPTAVTFPTDAMVADSDGVRGLSVYDLTGRPVLRLPDVYNPVFTPDGSTMVATLELPNSNNSLVSEYAFPSGTLEAALLAIPHNIPDDVELSGNGGVVAVAQASLDLVTLIDLQSGRTLATLQGDTNITNVVLDQTGSRLLTVDQLGSATGTSALTDAWNGTALPAQATVELAGTPSSPGLALTRNATAAWLTTPGEACVIRVRGRSVTCVSGYFAEGAIAPDGDRAVALYQATAPAQGAPSDDAAIFAVSASGIRPVKLITPPPGDDSDVVDAIALSPDGALVATATLDGIIEVWRTADGRLLWTRQVPTPALSDLTWSADGSRLLAAGENGMWLYDTATRKLLRYYAPPQGTEPSPTPDLNCSQDVGGGCPEYQSPVILGGDRVLAIDLDTGVALYDEASGRLITDITPPGTDQSYAVTGSSDGSTFAVSTGQGDVRAYSAATGQPTGDPLDLPPAAQNGTILPVTLTGDGSVLVALDGSELSAWQVATGDLLAQQDADAFATANDGAVLATVTGSSLSTFSCDVCGDPSLLLPDARALIPHGLSAAERATYLAGEPAEFK
jgi:WD40 repeat protein